MVPVDATKTMPRNDLRVNEKRWQRKRLFRQRRPRPVLRILSILFLLIGLVLLSVWLDLPPFDLFSEKVLS
jgi:hypothetical protein